MFKLLVNSPSGAQEIVEVSQSGSYFDNSLVIWDERVDGILPEIVLGKMVRENDQLVTLPDYLPSHLNAFIGDARTAKLDYLETAYKQAIQADIEHDGRIWLADESSFGLLSQVLSVGRVPPMMHWRDASGIPHAVEYTDLSDLAYAILVRGVGADSIRMQKVAEANAATSIDQLDAISWN